MASAELPCKGARPKAKAGAKRRLMVADEDLQALTHTDARMSAEYRENEALSKRLEGKSLEEMQQILLAQPKPSGNDYYHFHREVFYAPKWLYDQYEQITKRKGKASASVGKAADMRVLCQAWKLTKHLNGTDKWDNAYFRQRTLTVHTEYYREEDEAVPWSIMVGKVGGDEQVAIRGLKDGDIERIKNPCQSGPEYLYRHFSIRGSRERARFREREAGGSNAIDDRHLYENQSFVSKDFHVDAGWDDSDHDSPPDQSVSVDDDEGVEAEVPVKKRATRKKPAAHQHQQQQPESPSFVQVDPPQHTACPADMFEHAIKELGAAKVKVLRALALPTKTKKILANQKKLHGADQVIADLIGKYEALLNGCSRQRARAVTAEWAKDAAYIDRMLGFSMELL